VISEGMAVAVMEIYRKTRDTAVGLMGQVNNLCKSNGETSGTILKECRAGNDGLGAREAVISTF